MLYSVKLVKGDKVSKVLSWVLAVVLVILSGIVYRVLASRLKLVVEIPIKLPNPLSAFPMKLGDWTGKDVPIPPNILRVAGSDDFLNRLYINKTNNEWANMYVVYTARPRTMLGHRPEVCYVGGGWVHDETNRSAFTTSSGRDIPCLIHHFHTAAPGYDERIVLNFYIVNGRTTLDESVFTGLGWRTPNIEGNPARYVAQVQISSVLENSVRTIAEDITDLIVDFFPDEDGKTEAVSCPVTQSSKLK